MLYFCKWTLLAIMHRLFIICLSICLLCVPLKKMSRIWRSHFCRWWAAKLSPYSVHKSFDYFKEGSLSELCYVFLVFLVVFFFRFWCLTWRETIRSSTICVGVNAQHGEQGKRFYSKLWIACVERGNTIATPIIKISQYTCSLFSNNFALLPKHHRFCVWAQIRLFKMTC